MKFLILISFVVLSFLHAQMPIWFSKQQIKTNNLTEFVGYGLGENLSEARSHAKEDIASQLQTKVVSSFSSKVTDGSSGAKKELSVSINTQADAVLSDAQTVKIEELDGLYYVAVKYENLDAISRLKRAVLKPECSVKKQNPYLFDTPFYKELSQSFGCNIDVKIKRLEKIWYLKHKEHLVPLSNSELEDLFVSKHSEKFSFESSKPVLYDGDSFNFSVKTPEKRYMTLFSVYENGIVTLLQSAKNAPNGPLIAFLSGQPCRLTSGQ